MSKSLGQVAALTIAIIGTTSMLVACRSGGGGSRETCISYAPTDNPTPGTVATREGPNSSCDSVALEVVVTDVTDVFAVAFTVEYDSSIGEYKSLSVDGSLLASDGTMLETIGTAQIGRVTIGITRRQSNVGIDAVGTQLLATLLFMKAGNSGAGILFFSDEELLGSETPPQPKLGIQWIGGSLEID